MKTTVEDNLTRHMSRKDAEDTLAAEASTRAAQEASLEEMERLNQHTKGRGVCSNGSCPLKRFERDRVSVTLGGKEIEV